MLNLRYVGISILWRIYAQLLLEFQKKKRGYDLM